MSQPEPWPWPRTIATFVGSTILVAVLGRIPIPGVDVARLAPESRAFVSVLPDATAFLVLLRSSAVVVGRAVPGFAGITPRAAAALYALLAALQAMVIAMTLELIGAAETPGMAFRLVAVVSVVAAECMVWFLADLVSKSGRLHGATTLYGIVFWLRYVRELNQAGTHFQSAGWAAGVGLVYLVPIAVAVLGGLFLTNRRWPLPLTSAFAVRSGLDLALVSLAVGALVGNSGASFAARYGAPFGVAPAIATVVVVCMLAAYAQRREAGPPELRLLAPLVLLPTMAFGAFFRGTQAPAPAEPTAIEAPAAGTTP